MSDEEILRRFVEEARRNMRPMRDGMEVLDGSIPQDAEHNLEVLDRMEQRVLRHLPGR